jgi:hypothetical protein
MRDRGLTKAKPHLPSEGNLVAEFAGANMPMTVVVSNDYALAMAVVDGHPVRKKIPLGAAEPWALRAELTKFTNAVRTGQYAALDTER